MLQHLEQRLENGLRSSLSLSFLFLSGWPFPSRTHIHTLRLAPGEHTKTDTAGPTDARALTVRGAVYTHENAAIPWLKVSLSLFLPHPRNRSHFSVPYFFPVSLLSLPLFFGNKCYTSRMCAMLEQALERERKNEPTVSSMFSFSPSPLPHIYAPLLIHFSVS